MKARKAVYAASLDPITNGHINVIERMASLYDELIVLVAVDSRKSYTFTPDERVDMTKAAVAHLSNVSVDVCIGHYVVKQAESIGAQVIVRGLRNFKDFEDEQTLAEENRRICPQIETVWVPCLPNLMHVSSSMVKGHVGIDPEWECQVARSVPAAVVTKLKEKFVLGKARKYWVTLTSELGNPKGSEAVLKDLLTRYSESHRGYHNLAHIVAMLDELELVGENDSALALAIWFHDAVYDPKAKDNEEQSAKLAKDSVKQIGLPDSLGEQVNDMVMATKHTAVPTDRAAQVLVDIDLMVLGQPEKEFVVYEEGIRKEYERVPQPDFCAGRSEILQSFLDRPSIYSTEFFRDKYESAARKNLERSIEQLRK
ncbi:MAG TPA: pantetheine-phosphate adenylyltransferase [Candidatus Paceibacterota bacterium]|nr:pantetheine-phosphate adenylyltransferase [Candidatus Paceibacterota bacterium]HMO82541.1 pantetheine-phosphate adenylyltransferase [Candidatus Paceibacterota bacterium]